MKYADGCKIVLDGENRDKEAPFLQGPNGKLFPHFKSDIPDLEKKLAVATAFGALSDVEKAYHTGLADDEQRAAFLKLDADARTVAVKKAADSDETVELYVRTVRKSVVGADNFFVMKK